MDLSIIAPYIVSIIAAIISGISSYLVAHNKSASEIQTLKEANELEMEKLEAEHRYSLELANSNAQNEMTKQLMGSMVGNMMAAPQMQDFLMKAISDSYMKGQQE